jgi:hypothetical protein
LSVTQFFATPRVQYVIAPKFLHERGLEPPHRLTASARSGEVLMSGLVESSFKAGNLEVVTESNPLHGGTTRSLHHHSPESATD